MERKLREKRKLGNMIILVPALLSILLWEVLRKILYVDPDHTTSMTIVNVLSLVWVVGYYNIWFSAKKKISDVRMAKSVKHGFCSFLVVILVSLIVGIIHWEDNCVGMGINMVLTGILSSFGGFLLGNPKTI